MKQSQPDAGAAEVDVWLRSGGVVVTASERAARALTMAFHRARRAEGLSAWPAPHIHDWHGFARRAWEDRSRDGRLTMNPQQERALWAQIVGASGHGGALLEGPRERLAAMAMDAHRLLCAYAPRLLEEKARSGWQQDAAAFSGWLAEFHAACRTGGMLSAARIPLELLAIFDENRTERLPLLVAGFDRMTPVQRTVFDRWGEWREAPRGVAATQVRFHAAADEHAELTACALRRWRQLKSNSTARLLVVTQDLAHRRGAIERAFLRFAGEGTAAAQFEFSLGVPLGHVALTRGALLLLRWLNDALSESELDWLLSAGQTAASDAEWSGLLGFMRALRRRGLERTRWKLDEFMAQRAGVELPAAWTARMRQAMQRVNHFSRGDFSRGDWSRRLQTPFAWAELAPQLLEIAGWPGARPLTSEEFQALRAWQRALDTTASLGFDGRRVSWGEFVRALSRTLDETLFAPESRDAHLQIAGPAESAGLTADAVWFMGATEDAWPAAGAAHPLLPFDVQREAAMPHASAQLDWDLARAMTDRLLASAGEIHFSYARQSEGVEMRPSRIVAQLAGAPADLPPELRAPAAAQPMTETFADDSRVPLASHAARGGSTVLTAQSQCPFKAFATARLAAQGWQSAQPALTAAQRGRLLHAVLHNVWAGEPAGIRNHEELARVDDLRGFVEGHARAALAEVMPAAARETMPQRYLELEEARLRALVTEWLRFERERVHFAVARTELDVTRSIAGLTLNLRLDRIDRLSDGSLLVIDYKSGRADGPKLWVMPRPEDVQLPLYAGFGLDETLRTEIAREFPDGAQSASSEEPTAPLGGLVFAKVRTGEVCFAGRVGDARATLAPALAGASALMKKRFSAEELMDWRDYIEQMARDFIRGRAEVDPREYPKTCERCDLQALCRVAEQRAAIGADDDEEAGEESDDE